MRLQRIRNARSFVALFTSFSVACGGGMCGSRPPATSGTGASGVNVTLLSDAVPIDATLAVAGAVPAAPTSDELTSSVDALAPTVAPERYDVDVLARSLGSDIDKPFEFVRDRIRYEAYSGVLRDAHGALAARAANSFDRARLLARLLQVHGVQVRFATGTLPADRAEALFAHIFDGFRQPASIADTGQRSPFLGRVLMRARRDYPIVRTAIGSALSESVARARAQALKDIARHVWVQANVAGQWRDLDTAFGDSTPGRAYAAVAETVTNMPADWFQRISIRVLAEHLTDGALTPTTVLNITRPAVELIDRQVFLLHTPTARGGMGLGVAGGAGGDRWTPTLLLGDDTETGDPIDLAEEAGSGGFLDALGGGSSSTFVGEWIEFEVLRPDGRHVVTRRILFDRGSAAWRDTKPYDSGTLEPLERDGNGAFGPRAVRHLLFSAGPQDLGDFLASAAVVAFGDESYFGDEAPLIDQLFPLAVRDWSSLIWTNDVIIPAVNDTPDVRLYSDSPRLLIVSVTPGPDGSLTEQYDLRLDPLNGLARVPAAEALVADRKMLFAVLQGALEHEAVARDIVSIDGDASAVESTSARLTREGVTTLTPADVSRLSSITDQPETLARLRFALGPGKARLLVVPRAALTRGPGAWWEVSDAGNVRAVSGEDMNRALGKSGRLRPGGAQPTIRNPPKSHTIRPPQSWLGKQIQHGRLNAAKYYKNLPQQRAARARQRNLEYGMLVAMVIATIAVVAYVAYDYHQRAAQLAQSLEAIRAGSPGP